MKNNQLAKICMHFELGKPMGIPQRIHGGLLHLMWRMETEKGLYAVKQLNRDINLADVHIVDNYNLTENIASRFIHKGIPGVCALKQADSYLLIMDGEGFLVYPYVDAKIPDQDDLPTEHQALQIASILADMHAINLDVPEIQKPQFDMHANTDIMALVQKAQDYQCPFAGLLQAHLTDLLDANTAYHQALAILAGRSVVSHGDLDPKNVLWDAQNHPILIDWESARKLNPVYEIVNASLDWSGIMGVFNQKLFIKMIEAYKQAGGIIDRPSFEASFHGVWGNWLNWLLHNIERACTSPTDEYRMMGMEQVNQVLPTMMRLKSMTVALSNSVILVDNI